MSKPVGPLLGAFDTETTGLDPADGHRIIEFGLSMVDVGTGNIVYRYEQRFNPGRAIDAKAQAVHGISIADLAGAPEFSACIPTLRKIAKLAPVWVAHNAAFDAKFIAAEFGIAGQPQLDIQVLDTLDSRWATPNGKSPNLGELCFALGIPYDPTLAHAALYDTDVLAKCWIEGHKRGMYHYPEIAA